MLNHPHKVWIVILCLIYSGQVTDFLIAQAITSYPSNSFSQFMIPDAGSRLTTFDTAEISQFIANAQRVGFENDKRDSLQYYANQALWLSVLYQYPLGIRRSHGMLGYDFMMHDEMDSARYYLQLGIDGSVQYGDHYRASLYTLWYGFTYRFDAKWDKAIPYFKHSYGIATAARDTFMMFAAGQNLADAYLFTGNHLGATKLNLEWIRINERMKDTCRLIGVYHALAGIFQTMDDFRSQAMYANLAYAIIDGCQDSLAKAQVYWHKSTTALNYLQFDSALYFTQQQIAVGQKVYSDNNWGELNNWFPLTQKFLHYNQLDSAIYYYRKLVHDSGQRYQDSADMCVALADCLWRIGNTREAEKYYLVALKSVKGANIITRTIVYRSLYRYYYSNKQFKKAFDYLALYNTYNDSLISNRNTFNAEYVDLVAENIQHDEALRHIVLQNELQLARTQREKLKKDYAYGSIVLILMTGLYSFHRFKKYRNLKSREAILNERLRISRDLHDEVGSTLSGIAMYSHLTESQLNNAEVANAGQSVAIMRKSATEMVNKLSDIVWTINPSHDSLDDLLDRLEEYGDQINAAKNITFIVVRAHNLRATHLPVDFRKNIYLFCKEALNNAAKYSKASSVSLAIELIGHTLRFTIEDDGIGFDPENTRRGNGLNSMEERANAISGKCLIRRGAPTGTRVELYCPVP